MVSVHVIDNVLDEHTRNEYIHNLYKNKDVYDRASWAANPYSDVIQEQSEIGSIFRVAEKNVDLSTTVGYEHWVNVELNDFFWHMDKDEDAAHLRGELKFPLCTLIYYPLFDASQEGGNLLIKLDINSGQEDIRDIIVRPKNNRLIVLPPGTIYSMTQFTSDKFMLIINPFDYDIRASGEVGESHQTVNLAPSAE